MFIMNYYLLLLLHLHKDNGVKTKNGERFPSLPIDLIKWQSQVMNPRVCFFTLFDGMYD